jgi:hypothetical protein
MRSFEIEEEKNAHCNNSIYMAHPLIVRIFLALTLAGVPSIEYPVIITPFLESGAHNSNSSRLGPTCMNPGLARTTHGGPSAIFFSHPLVCGTLEICLHERMQINIAEVLTLEARNLLEHKRIISFRKPRANVIVHSVNICLIDSHAFPSQTRSIVDWDIVKIGVFSPVLVQDKEQFLSSTKSKRWEKNMTIAADDRMYEVGETLFLFFATFQSVNAEGTFHNQNIRSDRRNLCFDEMTILFARVVTCIQDFEPVYVNEEHAGTKNVACMIRRERNSRTYSDELMSRNRNNGGKRHRHVQRRE